MKTFTQTYTMTAPFAAPNTLGGLAVIGTFVIPSDYNIANNPTTHAPFITPTFTFPTYRPLGTSADYGTALLGLRASSGTENGNSISFTIDPASLGGTGLVGGNEFRLEGAQTAWNTSTPNNWIIAPGKSFDLFFNNTFDFFVFSPTYTNGQTINWSTATITLSMTYST